MQAAVATIPKFVWEIAAKWYELRNRDTRLETGSHYSKGRMMKRVISVLGLALAVGLCGQADAQTLKTVRDLSLIHI